MICFPLLNFSHSPTSQKYLTFVSDVCRENIFFHSGVYIYIDFNTQYSYSCLDIHLLQTCANITYTFNSSVINQSGSYLTSMYRGGFGNEDVFGLRFAICVMYVRTLMVKKSLSSLALGGGQSKYSDMFSVLSSKWIESPLICLAYFFCHSALVEQQLSAARCAC